MSQKSEKYGRRLSNVDEFNIRELRNMRKALKISKESMLTALENLL